MKPLIISLLAQAVESLKQSGEFDASLQADIQVENTRDKRHGDFASNIALTLAKTTQRQPRDIAQHICHHLPTANEITKTAIAGPGFINFFVSQGATAAVIATIMQQGAAYGQCQVGAGQSVQVEFVSANPTGPLHVGHGEGRISSQLD